MAVGLENVGISGVCGVRPAWPLVMSYPALIEKFDTRGPEGGANMPGTEEGGGLMGETIGGKAGEVEGSKSELIVKASVEVDGNWGEAAKGLQEAGSGVVVERAVDAGGLLTETELVPGKEGELDRPETQRTLQECFSPCLSFRFPWPVIVGHNSGEVFSD